MCRLDGCWGSSGAPAGSAVQCFTVLKSDPGSIPYARKWQVLRQGSHVRMTGPESPRNDACCAGHAHCGRARGVGRAQRGTCLLRQPVLRGARPLSVALLPGVGAVGVVRVAAYMVCVRRWHGLHLGWVPPRGSCDLACVILHQAMHAHAYLHCSCVPTISVPHCCSSESAKGLASIPVPTGQQEVAT